MLCSKEYCAFPLLRYAEGISELAIEKLDYDSASRTLPPDDREILEEHPDSDCYLCREKDGSICGFAVVAACSGVARLEDYYTDYRKNLFYLVALLNAIAVDLQAKGVKKLFVESESPTNWMRIFGATIFRKTISEI